MTNNALSAADIMPMPVYAKMRAQRRYDIIALKKKRRVSVGPDAVFLFENRTTILHQIHEMLHIEQGGADQIADELRAYQTLVPNGRELVATVMFAVADPVYRRDFLAKLGGVETHIDLRLDNETIHGVAEQDLDYTSAEGKASSVQFIHFPFTEAQIARFRSTDASAVIAITHPAYSHIALLTPDLREELAQDFA